VNVVIVAKVRATAKAGRGGELQKTLDAARRKTGAYRGHEKLTDGSTYLFVMNWEHRAGLDRQRSGAESAVLLELMTALPHLCERTEIELHTVSDTDRGGGAPHRPSSAEGVELRKPVPDQEEAARRVESYIRAHLGENLSVSDLAAVAGVSSRTLFRSFRELRGRSPRQSLEDARLERARLYLLHGGDGDSVTRSASDSGFTHLGRFSGLYKKKYGETPSETLRRSRLLRQDADPRSRTATRTVSSDSTLESSGNYLPKGREAQAWRNSDIHHGISEA
jgi:AraC-like DNA-binding protein